MKRQAKDGEKYFKIVYLVKNYNQKIGRTLKT